MIPILNALQASALALVPAMSDSVLREPPCTATASLAAQAARGELYGDFLIRIADCLNAGAPGDALGCFEEAWEEYRLGLAELGAVHAARLNLCGLIGQDAYSPALDPELFVAGVDHPLLPLQPGSTAIYEKHGEEGFERVEVEVLNETTEIQGVPCTATRVTETIDGSLSEVTIDWYAQDRDGNVWYFGESSVEFEGGVPISMDGSWRSGEDGAQAGIAMLAQPQVGESYRKEFKLGDAEDAATVMASGVWVQVPFGTFSNTLRVNDFSPLEPDDGEDEDKYYSAGIGLVLEVDNVTGDRLELVEILRR